MTDTLITS